MWAVPKEEPKPAAAMVKAVAAAPAAEAPNPRPQADLRDVEALAQQDPDFAVQVLRSAAQRRLNRHQAARAVALYEQAATLDPHDYNIVEEMADAQVEAKDLKGALASWGRILAVQKEVGVRFRYANFLSRVGEHDKAIEVGRALAEERPQDASLRYWIADAWQRAGKPSEAVAELKAMLKEFPSEKPEIERRLGLLEPQKVVTSDKLHVTGGSEPPAKPRR